MCKCACLLNIEQNNNMESLQLWKKMKLQETATMAESGSPQGWRRTAEVMWVLPINLKIWLWTILIRLSTEEIRETCTQRVSDISPSIRERFSTRLLCSVRNILCCAHRHSIKVLAEVTPKHIKLEQINPKMQINQDLFFLNGMENAACIMLKYSTGSGWKNISNANLNPQNLQSSRAKLWWTDMKQAADGHIWWWRWWRVKKWQSWVEQESE